MIRDFDGRVAVVTGGAAGIGLALARRLAGEGMKLAVADLRADALAAAAESLRREGAEVLAVPTDVADGAGMQRLSDAVLDRFGAVHLVCNVAAVSTRTLPLQDASAADWEWVLGVNLWGLLHAIRLFAPVMIAQNQPAHMVTFSSAAGLSPAHGLYGVSKHVVVAVSEALYRDFRAAGAKAGVSIIFPGPVRTEFVANSLANAPAGVTVGAGATAAAGGADILASGQSPEDVAACVIAAVRQDTLYAVTPARYLDLARARLELMTAGGAPDLAAVDALWARLHAAATPAQ